MKILVSGATGFVGANILRYLTSTNNAVSVLMRKTSNPWRVRDILNETDQYFCDLVKREKLRETIREIKPDVIIHLAAYGLRTPRDPMTTIQANFIGTVNIMDACAEIGFDCFINTGSCFEYGVKQQHISETELLDPLDEYGVSKAAATLYCQSVAKRENLPVFTLRLFRPYGYYEQPKTLISSIIISCLKKMPLKLFTPTAVRDFIFIKDVVDAYSDVITKGSSIYPGEILNVGTGKQHTISKVFEIVKKLTASEIKVEIGEVVKKHVDNAEMWAADNSRIKKIIGWSPKYDIESGLKKTVNWFEKNMHLYEV